MTAQCNVDGCDRPSKTRGMCGAHAERERRGVPIEGPINTSRPFDQQYIVTDTGCWEWQGAVATTGYGRLSRRYAHRVSFELVNGQIPEGLQIDHLCRNRICVNPDHLEAVTPKENARRGMSPGALAVRLNQCARGHEFTEDNVYRRANRPNKRECRTCVRAAQAGTCDACGKHFAYLHAHLRNSHREAA